MINQDNNDLYDLNEALKVENLSINDFEEICKRLKRKPNRTELRNVWCYVVRTLLL